MAADAAEMGRYTGPMSLDPNSLESVSVLIVDDDREIRALVRDYLSDHGLCVYEAADGRQMRQVMSAQPVHVVLLDNHAARR